MRFFLRYFIDSFLAPIHYSSNSKRRPFKPTFKLKYLSSQNDRQIFTLLICSYFVRWPLSFFTAPLGNNSKQFFSIICSCLTQVIVSKNFLATLLQVFQLILSITKRSLGDLMSESTKMLDYSINIENQTQNTPLP